jgi:hypothetical protein
MGGLDGDDRWSDVAVALVRLGDLLDVLQSGAPPRADPGELGHRAGQFGLVDPVAALAAGSGPVHEASAIKHL